MDLEERNREIAYETYKQYRCCECGETFQETYGFCFDLEVRDWIRTEGGDMKCNKRYEKRYICNRCVDGFIEKEFSV